MKAKAREAKATKMIRTKTKTRKAKAKARANTKADWVLCWILSSQCKAWVHMKKDCCEERERQERGKDTASLETPITPAANTTTERHRSLAC